MNEKKIWFQVYEQNLLSYKTVKIIDPSNCFVPKCGGREPATPPPLPHPIAIPTPMRTQCPEIECLSGYYHAKLASEYLTIMSLILMSWHILVSWFIFG